MFFRDFFAHTEAFATAYLQRKRWKKRRPRKLLDSTDLSSSYRGHHWRFDSGQSDYFGEVTVDGHNPSMPKANPLSLEERRKKLIRDSNKDHGKDQIVVFN